MNIAIVNDIKTNHHAIAICEIRSYDVWGNANDGWEVNDSSVIGRDIEIPANLRISNVPTHPGASDEFRSFSDSPSFNTELMVSFELSDSAIRAAADIAPRVRFDIEGDGEVYYVNRRSDGYPMGEIRITGWRAAEVSR